MKYGNLSGYPSTISLVQYLFTSQGPYIYITGEGLPEFYIIH